MRNPEQILKMYIQEEKNAIIRVQDDEYIKKILPNITEEELKNTRKGVLKNSEIRLNLLEKLYADICM